MNSLSSLKISVRLPLVIVFIVIFLTIFSSVSTFYQASSVVEKQVEDRLTAVLDSRKSELENYLISIQEDLALTASNGNTIAALNAFTSAWQELGSSPKNTLQSLYITENPHPTGEKDKLYDAGDGSLYSAVHAKYHPWFHQLQQEREYYDVFLFDLNANLVYSVFKELDYATNMDTGDWRATDLANAFRVAVRATSFEDDYFFDFKPYKPSFDAPASFISKPVMENGQTIGVLVFQMPIGRLNGIMQKSEGMGKTGETFIIGEDFLMRTDSRFNSESTILNTEIQNPTVVAAINGKQGYELIMRNGQEFLSASVPFKFLGANWALIAEMTTAEMHKPVVAMGWVMVGLGVVLPLLWRLSASSLPALSQSPSIKWFRL